MQRRQFLQLGMGLGLTAQAKAGDALVWQERSLLGFGTTLWLKAAHTDADRLHQALDASVKAIRLVEKQMSLFDPDSQVSRLNNRGELHQPDADLVSVLTLSQYVSRRSAGAFDVTTQALWNLWSSHANAHRLPSVKDLSRTRSLVNWQAMSFSPEVVRLHRKGMGVTLNGVAQGYAADKVRSVLQLHGVQHALIDTGETALVGQSPQRGEWRFAVEATVASSQTAPVLFPHGMAVATSSDAHTTFSDDRVHHHILDPHTGDSPTYWSSVTVMAPSCALADALTKVFFMCPPQQVARMAQQWNVGVVLQSKTGEWLHHPLPATRLG